MAINIELVLARCLIVEIDADHSVCAHSQRFGDHVIKGSVAGFLQDFFVSARAATDKVTHRGKHVAKDIGPDRRLACDDAAILDDIAAFHAIGRGDDDHGAPIFDGD